MPLFWMFLGFLLMAIGSNFILKASIGISLRLNISKTIIGLTIVSLVVSIPDLFLSLTANSRNLNSFSLNYIIGSNIVNMSLLLGIIIIFGKVLVSKYFFKITWTTMFVFSLILACFIYNDLMISRTEGSFLIFITIIFLFFLIKFKYYDTKEFIFDNSLYNLSYVKIFLWIIIALVAFFYGTKLLIFSALDLAKMIGVNESIISSTFVAVGNSIPVIATSILAISKNEKGLLIGNLIGSNIFNIGSVIGITALVKPIQFNEIEFLYSNILWMFIFLFLILIISVINRNRNTRKVTGFLLILLYSVFIISTYT